MTDDEYIEMDKKDEVVKELLEAMEDEKNAQDRD